MASAARQTLRFAAAGDFYPALKSEVDRFFATTGRTRGGSRALAWKTAFLIAWVLGGWAALIFAPLPLWLAALGAVLTGLGCGALGLNVPHDSNHGAYSTSAAVNEAMSVLSEAILGPSSFMWRLRHNVLHHVYPNIEGHDDTINYGRIARIKDHHPSYPFQRYQHIYIWPLYSIVLLKWFLYEDFKWFATGRMAQHRLEMRAADKAKFIACKLVWLSYTIALPLCFHPVRYVVLVFAIVYGVFSLALVTITQLAHVNEAAAFPDPGPDKMMSDEWIVHQLRTTADFGHDSAILNWYAGGLNYQVVHHLFPRVCHVHYPELTALVRRAIAESAISDRAPYLHYRTFGAALRSHKNFLKRMGRGDRPLVHASSE
jgi:linoleoyl-CoA desaturase